MSDVHLNIQLRLSLSKVLAWQRFLHSKPAFLKSSLVFTLIFLRIAKEKKYCMEHILKNKEDCSKLLNRKAGKIELQLH